MSGKDQEQEGDWSSAARYYMEIMLAYIYLKEVQYTFHQSFHPEALQRAVHGFPPQMLSDVGIVENGFRM